MREERLTELVDTLLSHLREWDRYGEYYVGLLERHVEGHRLSGVNRDRDQALKRLQEELLPEEWNQLPSIVAERQAGGRLGALSEEALAKRKSAAECREIEEAARWREKARRKAERDAAEAEVRREAARCKAELEAAQAAALRLLEGQRRAARVTLLAQIEMQFADDFLSADDFWAQNCDHDLLSLSEYEQAKARYVREWARGIMPDKPDLDPQQARAVGALVGDIEVVARAGAGKTRTLVTRALFLQQHCGVSPSEMLLLAFNRTAAKDIERQLEKYLDCRLPHVMTFHALAYALVHPEEELLYDDEKGLGLSRQLQGIIDEHLQSAEFGPLIKEIMLSHFEDDWERIVAGGFDLTIPELIDYRESLPRETLKGEYVKSFGERLIANTLFRNDVDYKYERNFRWNGINYKPDFTILLAGKRGVAIEYFGLEGDDKYDEISARKREFWAGMDDWTLLEFVPSDITVNGVEKFQERLLETVRERGVLTRRLSDEELWQRIERRAVDNFTKTVRTFVSRCRKSNLTCEGLDALIGLHETISDAEATFLEVGASVYAAYLERLPQDAKLDFDGMMWRAIECIREGRGTFARRGGEETGDLARLKHVLIDEFQDFSTMFHEMTKGIRELSPQVTFFCVGDDWQAINGFAGSELKFFNSFDAHFRNTRRLLIGTNYRSPKRIVATGNALMRGLGEPAQPHRLDEGTVYLTRFSDFAPTAVESARHDGDELTPAVLRLTRRAFDEGQEMVILSRRNAVPGYVNYPDTLARHLDGLSRFEAHIQSFFPREDKDRITVSTAHKYKGLQKSTVVILDANERCYPLIHPSWVFLRLFGDGVEEIEAAERRLLYVALTRAQNSLVVASADSDRESRYVLELRERMQLESLDWQALPPVQSLTDAKLEVRVFFAYDEERNEQMKNSRYKFMYGRRYWYRTVPADGFDFDVLCASPWAAAGGLRIEVYDEGGSLMRRRG